MSQMAVAIVSHNTRDLLHDCLAAVQAQQPSEIVVVDNASRDGSTEMVRASYPQVKLLANVGNPGYGAAANQAIAASAARYVLLLNADAHPLPGALAELESHLDRHPEAAVVGPRLVSPDGVLQPSCFPYPTPLHSLLEESCLAPLIRYVPVLGSRSLWTWDHGSERAVPWVLGTAMGMRRDAFARVNGFDESFFMYCEEVDLCYRLSRAGWKVRFTPAAAVVHVGGASTASCRVEMRQRRYLSRLSFYRRHYSGVGLAASVAVIKSGMLSKLLRDEARLTIARDAGLRFRLQESLQVWRGVLVERLCA